MDDNETPCKTEIPIVAEIKDLLSILNMTVSSKERNILWVKRNALKFSHSKGTDKRLYTSLLKRPVLRVIQHCERDFKMRRL